MGRGYTEYWRTTMYCISFAMTLKSPTGTHTGWAWLKLSRALKNKINTSADVFSDAVIRTKGKYNWRRAHLQKHMKVHVALDAPASEAENMRMWSRYEVFMTAILLIPIDLCQPCFWIISIDFRVCFFFTWINARITGLINPWPGGPNGSSTGMNRTPPDPLVTSGFKGLAGEVGLVAASS